MEEDRGGYVQAESLCVELGSDRYCFCGPSQYPRGRNAGQQWKHLLGNVYDRSVRYEREHARSHRRENLCAACHTGLMALAMSRGLWERRCRPALPVSLENPPAGIGSAQACEVSQRSQLWRRVHRIMDHPENSYRRRGSDPYGQTVDLRVT